MKLLDILSTEEIEVPRVPKEYIDWFDEVSIRIQQKLESDNELYREVILRTGLAKKFYEEMFPLYMLLRFKEQAWSSTKVQYKIGNQAFDVQFIKDEQKSNIPDFLEITSAIAGQDYHYRMTTLHDEGYVSMFGKLGPDGKLLPEEVPKCRHEIIAETIQLVDTAITKKISKGYSPNTALLICVEDYASFQHNDSDFLALGETPKNRLQELKKAFSSIYLILSSNGRVLEF